VPDFDCVGYLAVPFTPAPFTKGWAIRHHFNHSARGQSTIPTSYSVTLVLVRILRSISAIDTVNNYNIHTDTLELDHTEFANLRAAVVSGGWGRCPDFGPCSNHLPVWHPCIADCWHYPKRLVVLLFIVKHAVSPLPATMDDREQRRLLHHPRQQRPSALAYMYYKEEPSRRTAVGLLTRDEARRISVNFAKPPGGQPP
jgi:hypothetical protein